MDSTEAGAPSLPDVVRAAARGELPTWSVASPKRREHMGRVAALMTEWAEALDLSQRDQQRWTAAGWLHDALRDASEEELRAILPAEYEDMHPNLLHGPAAAHRLAGEADESLLNAIRYHTLGDPSLDRLGRALYLADFLEPGRNFAVEWRTELAGRMPAELDEVLAEVLGARIRHLVEDRKAIRPETAAFWSGVVSGR